MGYDHGYALQSAIYQALIADSDVHALCGEAVYDRAPPDQELPERYILIGAERVRNRSSQTHRGAMVDFEINVFDRTHSARDAKALASRIGHAMEALPEAAEPSLGLVATWFDRAQDYRLDAGRLTRIRILFRALIDTTQTS